MAPRNLLIVKKFHFDQVTHLDLVRRVDNVFVVLQALSVTKVVQRSGTNEDFVTELRPEIGECKKVNKRGL
jgi:hypothetical protein